MLERCVGPFIALQENLAVGVSETQTCPGWGLDMSNEPLWKPARGWRHSASAMTVLVAMAPVALEATVKGAPAT
jgi:hypothetical protein